MYTKSLAITNTLSIFIQLTFSPQHICSVIGIGADFAGYLNY